MSMAWIFKIIDWIKKETWWRSYYKRVNLDEKVTWGGRCLVCDAGGECNMLKGRDCPCKFNQCLKYK